jgi:hypothetical protein
MTDILTTALRFATQGIVAVPVAADGTKRPGLSTWKDFQHRHPTQDELLTWFGNNPDGVGVICGAISNNLEMLELEGRAVDAKMHIEIADIAKGSGLGDLWERLNSGYVEVTPSRGLHWLYFVADGVLPGNTKLARKPGVNGGVDVWAETRSEGGFTITAPSGSVSDVTHPDGGKWELIGGSIETIPTITMEERTALHNIFAMFDEMPRAEVIHQEIVAKNDGVLTPGSDFNAKTTWDEILIPLGWKKIYTQGEKTAWRRPNKDFGSSATTNFQGTDKLCVFTTSTIFETERSYDKFGAYALIYHNGDFKAAASDLRNKGYGPQSLNSFDLSNTPTTPNQLPKIAPTLTVEQSESVANSLEPNYEESSWKPVELKDYYDGLFQTPIATILKRTDGAGLIYQGRVHSFYGESESGKSWLAQIATAELLKSDKKVTYIDFESDASDVIGRMKSLGVSRANVLQYLTYIRPEGARDANDPYWKEILQPDSAVLVVIDGVTESLTMWGGETKDNDKITQWMRIFPRTVATASGAAVVLIDHITKNAETRGRFAIGGQAKLATIDGAAFLVEPIEGLAPGKIGRLTVRVTKDRPGFVRKSAGMYRKSDRTQEAAVIVIDSTKVQMGYIIQPPTDEDDLKENIEIGKRREIVEFVHNHGGCSRRDINRGVKGDDGLKKDRTDDLIDEGFIINKGNGKNFILYVTDLAKSEFGLFDAEITQIGGA